MPTLNRRNDGGYFIRHWYQGHATWQILGEGVRHLERHGIEEGSSFSTDLFMELWAHQQVYHGDAPTQAALRICGGGDDELRRRVREFYTLLRAEDFEAAWEMVAHTKQPSVRHASFTSGWKDFGLRNWHLDSVVSHRVPEEIRRELDSERLGTSHVRVKDQGDRRRDLKQYWLYLNEAWMLVSWDPPCS